MLLAGLLVGSYTISSLPLVPFPFSFLSSFLFVCLSVLETGSDSVALADLQLCRPGCPRTHGDPAASRALRSATFLIQLRPTCLGRVPLAVGWAVSRDPSVKTISCRHGPGQSDK